MERNEVMRREKMGVGREGGKEGRNYDGEREGRIVIG